VHEVAEAISREMSRVSGVDIGIVVMVDGDDLVPVALAGPRALPIEIERPLPPARGAYLRARAEHGAWAEPWQARPEDGIYGERMARAGLEGAAYVPLRSNGRLMGLLVLGTTRRTEVDGLVERLPSLVALGTVASSLLADGMRARATVAGERRSIEDLIEGARFRPVYQPVIELRTGEALGFEALTRFASGERPDLVFRRAADVGLGMRLEEVTLAAAIAGAGALPSSAFLSLNVSPSLLVRSDALADVLHEVTRPVVLEVTEHAEIDDYGALREAARRLPIPIRLAVDDAGAGFASLRHVLELAPDIVKIDHSIVTGIDGDPTRQALVAGLRFFASRRSIQLIAEGVETPSELATLSALSIPLGQGFLLGRPMPAGEAAGANAVFGGLGVPEALGPAARGATRSRSVTGPARSPGQERRGNGGTHGNGGANGNGKANSTAASGEVSVRPGEADGSSGASRLG
jgi:EAL domain-containing protein (putative c-di-GMP-specific phosphodiesterase class I)